MISLRRLFARRRPTDDDGARWTTVVGFAAGLCLATAALVWLGYIATREWRRGTDLLQERSAAEALALVAAALNADMKGAWATLLLPMNQRSIEEEPPYDLLHPTARAFARFPYAESLVIWKDTETAAGQTYVFSRAERRPHWDHAAASDDPFPVVLQQDPPALRRVVAALRQQATTDRPFVSLDIEVNGEPYQVVAHLLFSSARPYPLVAMTALTVNLEWIKANYFKPLLTQVARIGGSEEALTMAIFDDAGSLVTATGAQPAGVSGSQRRFPVLFVDSALVSGPFAEFPYKEWTVRVTPRDDSTVAAALRGARRTFVMMTIAAAVSLLALLLTVRADRASAALATMKSDFVSAVTHELKTPLALITLVGDTLAQGRYTSTETIQDYAKLLSQEAGRLSRSIDSLLTYARYGNAQRRAPFEPTLAELHELVEDALEQFRPRLAQLGFGLTVDVPPGLPAVQVERPAMVLVMENLIDNAIKYSRDARVLNITAGAKGSHVHVTFADRGIGIAAEDLERVFDRFFRGRNATEGGSGLGLSIARRIVQAHGGRIDIRSTAGVGTAVTLHLQAAIRS